MKKNTTKLILVLLMSLCAIYASAVEIDGICYIINGSEATVTYRGGTAYYNTYSGNVIIPSTITYNDITYTVTSIGYQAFYNCNGLMSISIPNTISSIDRFAFSGCSSLTSVTIPNSVTSIGGFAFEDCSSLETLNYNAVDCSSFDYNSSNNCQVFYSTITTINIGDEVKKIPGNFARGLYKLTNITIPNSVTAIGAYAFYGCGRLTSVTIPNSVTAIGEKAFWECTALETLNYNAVDCADFTYVNDGYNIKRNKAFHHTLITTINIGDEVKRIPNYFAYNMYNICSITIPNSVTSVGNYAFSECPVLTSFSIGNSVTSIGSYAFSSCSGLTSINIPNSVTSIGSYAFSSCSGLTSINIPNSVTSIGSYAFSSCSGLTSINIPNSVTSIGSSVFSGCTSLKSVTIPNSVTTIDQSAFSYCTGLASVTIPESVTAIGKDAFFGCTGLTSINIADIAAWCRINFYSYTDSYSYHTSNPLLYAHHLYLNGSEVINLVIPNSIASIGESTFIGGTGIISVTIPNSVTSIREKAFCGSGLISVTVPSSVTSIGGYAFSGCTSLKSVTIPNSVTTIDQSAFSYCTGLASVTIPNSIITINDYVFSGCIGLVNVKLPKTLKSIANYAFQGCTGLTSITIPESVTTIGNYAFSGCTGLNNVNIPNSVTSIGNYAFQGCTGLTSATIKSYLTSIGSYTFSNCGALSSFTCMPETPPIFDNSNSFNTYSTTSLYVPRSGVENYKTHTNWRRFTKIYEFVGYFTVPDVNVSKGKTVVVPVSMTNEADIIGFQTDIYLPEGFEFVKDGNDYVVDPSDRMARDHSIMCNVSDDGALRVLCFSPTNKVISGNEGELFYVTIKAPADTVGDFSLCFKNTILTTSDAEELLSPDAYTSINVIPYLPGDANGNGEVSVIDIVTSAQYIIFQNPDPFLFEAADLNNDEQITVTDLALIANLILYPTMNAPKRVPILNIQEEQIHGNDIQLNVGETQTVTITLDNFEEYSAFQMDVKLPCGLTANNFRIANQSGSHSFITSEEKDGMIRALCYSPSLTSLGHDDKPLLAFDVTSIGNIVGDIIIDGIEIVTTTCNPVHLDALTISVNQTNTINEISNGKSAAHIDYYNLAGHKQAEPAKGVTIIVTTYSDGSRSSQKVIL